LDTADTCKFHYRLLKEKIFMNTVSRGVRNAFRNLTRTSAIVVILGLSMGLALSMLIARQAVNDKISDVKASVGNTVSITPAGFSGFSQVNNSLTTSQLSKLSSIDHISGLNESLTDRLSKTGSTTTSFGPNSSSNSNATTSLSSPVTLNTHGGAGRHFFIAGGGSLPTSFSLPVSIVGTNDPSYVSSTTLKLTSGKMISSTADDDSALISSKMASKNSLKVGSTFMAYGSTMTVAGIFSGSTKNSTQALDDSVIVSLVTEQKLSGQTGDITSAVATVDSLDNLSSVTSQIKSKLGSTADVTSSVEQANNTVAPLNSVRSITLYSLIGAVIAGSVIILLTMVMIVRERTREIGVLKAIGASNSKVTLQFMSEAVTLTLCGAVVGIILGAIAANPITHTLVNNSSTSTSTSITAGPGFGGRTGGGGGFGGGGGGAPTTRFTDHRGAGGLIKSDFGNIHAAVGFGIILDGLVAAIVISLVGSSAVSYFIAKIRPAEVMRTE
jgi:putative ABC transport system permease protein